MILRSIGNTGIQVSAVSVGGGAFIRDQVSSDHIARVLDFVSSKGVNMIDTGEDYGLAKLGRALMGRRENFVVSMKSTASHRGAMEKVLERSLRELGTDHLEIFQMQTIQSSEDLQFRMEHGALEVLEEAQKRGVIKLLGISTHRIPVAVEAIRSGRFDVVTIPYSVGMHASEPAIYLAAEHGVGVFAMMPLGGGLLVGRDKESEAARTMNSPDALRFVLTNKGITTALVGMSSVEHAWENLDERIFTDLLPEDRQARRDHVFSTLGDDFCRSCKACLPCDVFGWQFEIDNFFRFRQYHDTYGYTSFKQEYGYLPLKADECTSCGYCESRCPYDIPIVDRLRAVHDTLGDGDSRIAEHDPQIANNIVIFIRRESERLKQEGNREERKEFLEEYAERFPSLEVSLQLLKEMEDEENQIDQTLGQARNGSHASQQDVPADQGIEGSITVLEEDCRELARLLSLGQRQEALTLGRSMENKYDSLAVDNWEWEVRAAQGFLITEGMLVEEDAHRKLELLETYWSYLVHVDRLRGVSHEGLREMIESFLESYPDNPVLLNYLGECDLELGEYDRALRELSDAIASRPEMVWPRVSLAKCLLHTDSPSKALEILEEEESLSDDELNIFHVRYLKAIALGRLERIGLAGREAKRVRDSPFWESESMPFEQELSRLVPRS